MSKNLVQAFWQNLLGLFKKSSQRTHFEALLALFLRADGQPLPQHTPVSSPSSLSRLLSGTSWNTLAMQLAWRRVVHQALEQALFRVRRGRPPVLELLVDLTTLEKTGAFAALPDGLHTLDGKRGLHLVVLYVRYGELKLPYAVRVWRGKDTPSPAQLALAMVRQFPTRFTQGRRVRVLGDGGFGSVAFLEGVHALGYTALTGMRHDRLTQAGMPLSAHPRGKVVLTGLSLPLYFTCIWLKRKDTLEARYVVSTTEIKPTYLGRVGKRRWQIEAFFKTMKSRFGVQRFGQSSWIAVLRYLLTALVAYTLCHLRHLASHTPSSLPDWRDLAQQVALLLIPLTLHRALLAQLERLKPHLAAYSAAYP